MMRRNVQAASANKSVARTPSRASRSMFGVITSRLP